MSTNTREVFKVAGNSFLSLAVVDWHPIASCKPNEEQEKRNCPKKPATRKHAHLFPVVNVGSVVDHPL